MNVVEYLKWDSEFFSMKIGACYENLKFRKDDINKYDLIYCYNGIGKLILNQTENFKKGYEEYRILYRKELKQKFPDDPSILSYKDYPSNVGSLLPLAYESGKYSRFSLDENFTELQFEQLYETWLSNSITGKIADVIYFYLKEKQIIGFVTISLKGKEYGQIGLISVLKDYQGEGIGRRLLEKAENYTLENNRKFLMIPTQKHNIGACAFYEKLGYLVYKETMIEHLWKY